MWIINISHSCTQDSQDRTYLTLKVITYKWWIKSLQRKKCKHIIKDWFKLLSFDRHLILTCSSVKSSLDSVADCPHVGGTLGKWWLGGGQDVTTLPGQQHDLLLEGVYLLGLKLHQLYQSLSLSDVGLPSSWKLLTLQKRTFTYIFVLLHLQNVYERAILTRARTLGSTCQTPLSTHG